MKIAISGFAGSGKTALANKLYSILFSKYPGMSLIKPTFKDLAKEKGLSLMEFQELAEKDFDIDREFDNYIKKKASESQHCIVSTWLAIWMVDADLRVFLYSSVEERARRVAKRDGMSFMNALEHVKERDEQNIKRYKEVYNIDITNFNERADIVLNSSSFSIDGEVKILLSAIEART